MQLRLQIGCKGRKTGTLEGQQELRGSDSSASCQSLQSGPLSLLSGLPVKSQALGEGKTGQRAGNAKGGCSLGPSSSPGTGWGKARASGEIHTVS